MNSIVLTLLGPMTFFFFLGMDSAAGSSFPSDLDAIKIKKTNKHNLRDPLKQTTTLRKRIIKIAYQLELMTSLCF